MEIRIEVFILHLVVLCVNFFYLRDAVFPRVEKISCHVSGRQLFFSSLYSFIYPLLFNLSLQMNFFMLSVK